MGGAPLGVPSTCGHEVISYFTMLMQILYYESASHLRFDSISISGDGVGIGLAHAHLHRCNTYWNKHIR